MLGRLGGTYLFSQWQTRRAFRRLGSIAPRQPYPQYGGTFSNSTNIGNASYNSLQARVEQRLSHGLSFLGSYTYSKSLDLQSSGQAGGIVTIYDLSREWGPSDFDFTHMFVFSSLYELPFGKGKRFLSSSGRAVDLLIGGWNVAGILSMYSGAPFSVLAGGDFANVGGGT